MMHKQIVPIIAIGLLLAGTAFGLTDSATHDVDMTVDEIALIDLNDTSTVALTIAAPASGGETPASATDTSKRIQYTSIVSRTPSVLSRNLTVNWGGTDAAPAGTSLVAEVTSISGGVGTCGTPAAAVTVSATGQNLLTGIGGCATGTGTNGAVLSYTLNIDDFTVLDAAESTTATITFTLAEDA